MLAICWVARFKTCRTESAEVASASDDAWTTTRPRVWSSQSVMLSPSHALNSMICYLVRYPLSHTSRCSFRHSKKAAGHVIGLGAWNAFTLATSSRRVIGKIWSRAYNEVGASHITTAEKAEKLRALGAEKRFVKYDPLDRQHVNIMEAWYAKGPPPLSEYRLTFGKHKGRRLDDVPDTYLVKYMIPRRHELHLVDQYHDPLVFDALAEHLKRHPDLKSQAGNKKTTIREGGLLRPLPRGKPGRPRKYPIKDTTPQAGRP